MHEDRERVIITNNKCFMHRKIENKLVKRHPISNKMHVGVIIIIKNEIHARKNRK